MVTVLPPSFISIQDMQESHLFNAHFGAKQANRGVNHKGSRSARCVEQRGRKTTSPSPPKSYTAEQARTFLARPSSRATGSSPGGVCAALVELNCETDFVARNALLFGHLSDLAHTAVCLAESGSGSGSDDQM